MATPAQSGRVSRALAQSGIQQTGVQWFYRPAVSRGGHNFEPHRDLDRRFARELPFECNAGWLGDRCTPGDHKGCLCNAAPVLRGPGGRFAPRRTGG